MFDPNQAGLVSYNYHGTMIYIDPKAKLADMKKHNDLFFKTNKRKGERFQVYRGHLINIQRVDFTRAPNTLVIHVYAFNVLDNDLNSIASDPGSIEKAKRIIDEKMDRPEPNPLTLSYEEVEVLVPAKIKVQVFRDTQGKVTNATVHEFLSIGDPKDRIPVKEPHDGLCTCAWNLATKAAYNGKTTP